MQDDEHIVKYLELLHATITRMGNNSFLIKGWAITTVSAIAGFLLVTSNVSVKHVTILFIPIIGFCLLDTYYLIIERKLKIQYESTAEKLYSRINNGIKLYKIASKDYNEIETGFVQVLFSESIMLTYFPLLAVSTIIFFII